MVSLSQRQNFINFTLNKFHSQIAEPSDEAVEAKGVTIGKNVIPKEVLALIRNLVCTLKCKLPKLLQGPLELLDPAKILRILKIDLDLCECKEKGTKNLISGLPIAGGIAGMLPI